MNTAVLMPYQIIEPYLHLKSPPDETLEAQWVSFVKDRQAKWPPGINVLPLVDVSGSMFNGSKPSPGVVAIALGMLFATLNSSAHFTQKFITFDTNPQLLTIPPGTLCDQVNFIKGTPWGGSTNFQAAFDLILGAAQLFKVPPEHMPQIMLVLSDMQFNSADSRTNWDAVEAKYAAAGYKRPTIIFWNLNGTTIDYPVPNASVPDCMLLSGFNDAIMYSLLDAKMPSPAEIVHKALDAERYNMIELAPV
jgi:hypothetical protein